MKYSAFSLTLPQWAPAEAAKIIKEAGYDGIEWRCHEQPAHLAPIPNCWTSNRTTLDTAHWEKLVPEYRRIMDDHGLECPNLGAYCRADHPEAVKRDIEIAQALGAARLRITAPPYDGKSNYHELFQRAREAYAKAADLCKNDGVQGQLDPCEMKAGFVDWTAVFVALKSVGYHGWVSNEDFQLATGSSAERLRFGLEHLRRCETLA